MIAGSTTLALAISGEDLHVALVTIGPLRAETTVGPVIRGFVGDSAEEARQALAPYANVRAVSLVVPGEWCAIRPTHLTSADWRGARDELIASIDRLVPIPPDDAAAGLVEVFPRSERPDAPAVGGALVVIRRSQLEPWLGAIERALGRPVSRVLSPQMAMLGLGLQCEPAAIVVEALRLEGVGDVELLHRLEWGRPVAIADAQSGAGSQDDPARTLRLSRGHGGVSPAELAVAGVIAPTVAGAVFRPLLGKPSRPARPWLAPTIAATAAALLALLASPVFGVRLARAQNELLAREEAIAGDVRRAHEAREQAERLARLLGPGVSGATGGWRSVLPAAAAAQQALGPEGFLYRLEVSDTAITITGEAPSASAVLERMETAGGLRAARHTAPVSKSSVSGMDVFDIRAERSKEKSK